MHPRSLLLVVFAAFGCADPATSPRPLKVPTDPVLATGAQPSELPNVIRFKDVIIFQIVDEKSGLIAAGGLPDNLRESDICGGTAEAHFGVVEVQWVGLQQAIIKAQARGEGNLDVYDLATFTDFCADAPIAHGTGTIAGHTNDLFMTSGRAFLFGFSMQGTVTLASGGTAQLSANVLEQISASGEFRPTVSQVRLR